MKCLHPITGGKWLTVIAALAVVSLLSGATPSFAADNIASGDIAGVSADLDSSNTVTLNATTLALSKAAFLANGTLLPNGANVPKGTVVKFLIYIDNTTAVPVDSVSVQDVLDPMFAYQTGTIKADSSLATGATAAAIFTAVDAAAALTDAVSGADEAGISGATISAGSGTGNKLLTIPASKVYALLATVKIQ